MMKRRLALAVMVTAMLSVARPSSAFLEWIWELSGPSMLGTGAYCSIDFDLRDRVCDEYGYLVVFKHDEVKRRFWVRTQSAFLFSTWNNSTDSKIYATTFEAVLEGRWTDSDSFMIYSGAGYSGNIFFGSGFDTYNNPAWIVTPFGARFNVGRVLVSASFDIRWFDKTFNPVDVSNPLPGTERTYGASITVMP